MSGPLYRRTFLLLRLTTHPSPLPPSPSLIVRRFGSVGCLHERKTIKWIYRSVGQTILEDTVQLIQQSTTRNFRSMLRLALTTSEEGCNIEQEFKEETQCWHSRTGVLIDANSFCQLAELLVVCLPSSCGSCG